AYIIPSVDQHQSEYIADRDQRLKFVSNFSGSRGLAVVTSNQAALWTDGRYFLQAEKQLDPNLWTLMKEGQPETPTVAEFLKKNLPGGSRVGLDAKLATYAFYEDLRRNILSGKLTISTPEKNFVDEIWAHEQPPMPKNPLIILPLNYTAVEILPYNDFYSNLTSIIDRFLSQENDNSTSNKNTTENTLIWTPSNSANFAIWAMVKNESRRCDKMSPVQMLKAIKNPTELAGITNAQIKDGVAHCQFFHWLENQMSSLEQTNATNNETADIQLNEIGVDEKFQYFRSKQQDFMGLSFDTISAVGSNSAIIHYKPTVESNTELSRGQLYLVDSGSQFKDGTTDITRTISFDEPSDYEKECFTRVLKGHINLAKLKFPEGTNGFLIDSAARTALWDVGLDYLHGTGHGVGHFLNVHEGPAGLGTRASQYTDGFKENMIMTIEPGYYEDGKFGIRIESDFVIKAVETKYKFKDKKMLTFEPLTLVPIQLRMIDVSLLDASEKEWLNNYHKKCLDVLGPI
uniref:Uncharacterized protein n=1 Tax=Romanomermis culicivorax TaxID=13658 RepID=A0A915I2C5_ROMCU